MPVARCISNGSYALTIGREYEIQIDGTYCYVTDNNGLRKHVYLNRFQLLDMIQSEFQLRVGQVVTVRSDLRENEEFRNGTWETYGDHAQYAGRSAVITRVDTNDNSFKIDIDNGYSWWIEEMCESAPSIQTTTDNAFAVYDIVRVTKECSNKDKLAYIVKITQGNRIVTNLSNFDIFNTNELVKVSEEDITTQIPMPVPDAIAYTQKTGEIIPVVGSRVKFPTRKIVGDRLTENNKIIAEIKNGTKYLEVKRVTTSIIEVKMGTNVFNFSKSDLEVLPTKFVQGVLENGHRIKDNNGKTHTYEAYATGFNTLISETNDYIEYTDSSGWYMLQFKGLVTKPRGTIEYTEYFTLTPEDYIAYKAEQEERNAYLKSLVERQEVINSNDRITMQVTAYQNVKACVVRAKELKERLERERIEREERERQMEEERKYGIWKHHKDIWN